jgi:hypothetical protein
MPPHTGWPSKRQRQNRLFMYRMVRGCHPQQRLAANDFGVAMFRHMGHQCEVNAAAVDLFEKVDRRLANNREFHSRVGAE